jgi:hypothetical protein
MQPQQYSQKNESQGGSSKIITEDKVNERKSLL